jgi:hypothetical protein
MFRLDQAVDASRFSTEKDLQDSLATNVKPPIRCEFPTTTVPDELKFALVTTCGMLLSGGKPQLVEEGMGGTYFCPDKRGNPMAVFKPRDEEPCAPENPKSLTGNLGDMGIKPGIRSGEQAIREVAAYILDRGLARVPVTIMVSLDVDRKTKIGSLQHYVAASGTSGDMGTSRFDVRDAQAIALLDMRLFNTDRHDGNVLVQEAKGSDPIRLVPIDHGCCLPDSLNVSCFEWTWLTWPQLKQPILPAIRDEILSLDIGSDCALLRELGIREECIRTFKIASQFVQQCVRLSSNITLAHIANWMCREELEVPSVLEKLVARCRWRAALLCVQNPKQTFDSAFDQCYEMMIEELLLKQN